MCGKPACSKSGQKLRRKTLPHKSGLYAVASYSCSIAVCRCVGLAAWRGDKLQLNDATGYNSSCECFGTGSTIVWFDAVSHTITCTFASYLLFCV
jgi:hypothetical protein